MSIFVILLLCTHLWYSSTFHFTLSQLPTCLNLKKILVDPFLCLFSLLHLPVLNSLFLFLASFSLFFLHHSLLHSVHPSASCISEPMVCTMHPPASHSAPSFLRQYAGHLGRTALRREPGGGLERDRAYLSLHRTGSLGTHTNTHRDFLTYFCVYVFACTLSGFNNTAICGWKTPTYDVM